MLSDLFGIDKFFQCINQEPLYTGQIRARCAEMRAELVNLSFWEPYQKKFAALQLPRNVHTTFDADCITAAGAFDSVEHARLFEELLMELRPWRKGPFSLFGTFVDSEWQSFQKWKRMEPHLPALKGKVVADFGCNNGYYLFKLLPFEPHAVLGLDPNGRFYYQFQLLHRALQPKNIFFEPLGVEDAPLFDSLFDIVFCLGVIYHRKDPMQMLMDLKASLRPGGTVFIESITVPGRDGECLIPKDRYAMMRNVWFIPTPETLATWLERAGYVDVSILDTSLTTIEEQRKTAYSHFDSLSDFLDPGDHSRTVEGYPAPHRTIVKAKNCC